MISSLFKNPMWNQSPPYVAKIISVWFERAQDLNQWPSVFDRFIFLWIAFDAWGTCESGRWNDPMIRFVSSSPLYELFDKNRLTIEKCLQGLAKERIPDYRKDPKGRVTVNFHGPIDFPKLMETLYVVRNNLFHGHKSPTDEEDERIVGEAWEALTFVMQYVHIEIKERLTR